MAEEVSKEKPLTIDYTPPPKSWMEPAVEFRKGTYGYPAAPKHEKYLDLPNPGVWQPTDKDWKLPENWKETILRGMKDRLEPLSVISPLPRYLCEMRSLCGQVPFLHRLRGSEEYACPEDRAAPVNLSEIFHTLWKGFW